MPSVLETVCHGPEVPITEPPDTYPDLSSESDDWHTDDNIGFEDTVGLNQQKTFTQSELNDLTRNICLSKESALLLGSCLRQANLLAPGTIFYWYRDRDKEFRFFLLKYLNTALV